MELSGEIGRVDTTMSVSRVPSPTEMACQVAENWCYTQVQISVVINITSLELESSRDSADQCQSSRLCFRSSHSGIICSCFPECSSIYVIMNT